MKKSETRIEPAIRLDPNQLLLLGGVHSGSSGVMIGKPGVELEAKPASNHAD